MVNELWWVLLAVAMVFAGLVFMVLGAQLDRHLRRKRDKAVSADAHAVAEQAARRDALEARQELHFANCQVERLAAMYCGLWGRFLRVEELVDQAASSSKLDIEDRHRLKIAQSICRQGRSSSCPTV